MEQTTAKAIELSVRDMVIQNLDTISEKLLSGTTDTMTEKELTVTMMLNCVSLSTSLAVQAVLGILQDAQIIGIDEHLIAKLLLKQLSPETKD